MLNANICQLVVVHSKIECILLVLKRHKERSTDSGADSMQLVANYSHFMFCEVSLVGRCISLVELEFMDNRSRWSTGICK